MFQIGQKVVYVGSQRKSKFPGFKRPNINDTVTIKDICKYDGTYYIEGYLKDHNGRTQSFYEVNFITLDELLEHNKTVEKLFSTLGLQVN